MNASTHTVIDPVPGSPGRLGDPGDPAGPSDARTGSSTWTLRRPGVRTVAALELRQRVRSTRWQLALGIWFVAVGLVTWLTFVATRSAPVAQGLQGPDGVVLAVHQPPRGPVVFGVVIFFVLLAGMLVAPTLSAGTINGDRSAGTLATLQVTLLSPAEIAVGKLCAGWVAALAFLVASLPFVGFALAIGGVRVVSLVVTLVLLVVLLGVVCAVGLGFSALVARTTASALLTYLVVLGLSLGTVFVFVLTFPLVTRVDHVRTFEPTSNSATDCSWQTETVSQAHTEKTWWLLAANPFVVVADAAPPMTSVGSDESNVFDPLGAIRDGVRELRAGPATVESWCPDGTDGVSLPSDSERASHAPVWPWGLAADLVLGAGGVWVAVRRLRIPQTKLARGTRVA